MLTPTLKQISFDRKELDSKGRMVQWLGNKEILVLRYNHSYVALNGMCVHEGGPLCEGKIIAGQLQCPWHGWRFDLKSGGISAKAQMSHCISFYEIKIHEKTIDVFVPETC